MFICVLDEIKRWRVSGIWYLESINSPGWMHGFRRLLLSPEERYLVHSVGILKG